MFQLIKFDLFLHIILEAFFSRDLICEMALWPVLHLSLMFTVLYPELHIVSLSDSYEHICVVNFLHLDQYAYSHICLG